MFRSADQLGGQDPLNSFLNGYIIEKIIFALIIPSLLCCSRILSSKIKSMPTIRIDFPTGTNTVFFINLPDGKWIQLKKILRHELDLHGQIFPSPSSIDETVENVMIRTKVDGSGQEYLIKYVLQSYGLQISKIIREKKKVIPRLELIQF